MKLPALTLAAILAASTAFAIPATDAPVAETPPRGETPVTPLPGPTLPNPPETPIVTHGGGDPVTPYVRQYWTGQCRYLDDGRIITHTAFGLEPFAVRQALAHEQCRARLIAE